ncbi:MAG TPA: hypothetical protein VMS55_17130 [Myxococcota bacterium]|nr:hypothetical protein [Myxococcota bacterium]
MSIRFLVAAVPATVVTWGIFAVPAARIGIPNASASESSISLVGVTLADADPSDSDVGAGADFDSFCAEARENAKALLPSARACERESDCFHYPCSCSALGSSPATDEYLALQDVLVGRCGDPMIFAYCGPTVPVCEAHVCTVRGAADEQEIEEEIRLARTPRVDVPAVKRQVADLADGSFTRDIDDLAAKSRANPARPLEQP